MASEINAAGVYILDNPYSVDRRFDYFLPGELRDKVVRGSFVSVPFGRGNRQVTAVVTELLTREDTERLKPLTQVFEEDSLCLDEEMIGLCFFLKEQTFCTFGDAVRATVPTGALRGMCACYRAEGKPDKSVNEPAKAVYCVIAEKTAENGYGVPGEQLQARFGAGTDEILQSLMRLHVIRRIYRVKEQAGRVYEKIYAVSPGEHTLPQGRKQRELYDYIALAGEAPHSEMLSRFGACQAQLSALLKSGHIRLRQEEIYRRAYTGTRMRPDDNQLTGEQEQAKKTIVSLLDSGQAKAALLYGVTGSGKTRVMKSVIDSVLEKGRGVIVLVPEISLTPQTVGLFSSYFGDQVAILHSGLSVGQRYDEWRRLKEGRARICIGTRSAVFAPVRDLGLIIIDEEQEHTYKSDMSPRYHARDVARFRCAHNNAVMLLCSATPSVESYYKAKQGIYTLCTLKKRYGDAPLPKAILCDMRGGERLVSPIGALLGHELEVNLERGEQSVLFVGRRGYNNFATCTLCGETITCPHCSVSLTYHALGRYRPEENSTEERARHGYLACHYCGYRARVPLCCPSCGSDLIQFIGSGTQMVESELERLFPGARLLRLDADTTGSKDAFETKLDAFRRHEADIMLGTQMVTKGHDFPEVTLVGVTNADTGLYLDDFRAGEHSFSLITQVIGRAGRADKPGRAVIQTYQPDHPTMILAAKQDYPSFYENEIKVRRALLFPPFCDILLLTLSAGEEAEVRSAAEAAKERIASLRTEEEYKNIPMVLFGPFEAPLYRLKDQYRMRFVMKTKNTKALRKMIDGLILWFAETCKQRVTLSADMNPSSI